MATVKKLFSLDVHIAQELQQVASALNTTQKDVVENALNFYFDYTDGVVGDKIIDEIKSGDMSVYDSKDLYKELGIELNEA